MCSRSHAERVPISGQGKRLHLGCGLTTPEGWINVDASWNAKLAKYPLIRKLVKAFHIVPKHVIEIPWSTDVVIHDVRRPLPFEDNSSAAIYSSHLLEHLYLKEAKNLLRECFRVLQPGGVLRMVVPDLEAMVRQYIREKSIGEPTNNGEYATSADKLLMTIKLRRPEPPSMRIFYRIYSAFFDFHSHKWSYDGASLTKHLQSAGFVNVEQQEFMKSKIEGIEALEENPHENPYRGGVCVEGVKPYRYDKTKDNP